jgi:hypothetical protein
VKLNEQGTLIVSLYAMTIFAGIVVLVYFSKDTASFQQVTGAATAMIIAVTGYWVGSSRGSDKKSDTIAAIAAAPQPQPPALAAPSAPAVTPPATTTQGATP